MRSLNRLEIYSNLGGLAPRGGFHRQDFGLIATIELREYHTQAATPGPASVHSSSHDEAVFTGFFRLVM